MRYRDRMATLSYKAVHKPRGSIRYIGQRLAAMGSGIGIAKITFELRVD